MSTGSPGLGAAPASGGDAVPTAAPMAATTAATIAVERSLLADLMASRSVVRRASGGGFAGVYELSAEQLLV